MNPRLGRPSRFGLENGLGGRCLHHLGRNNRFLLVLRSSTLSVIVQVMPFLLGVTESVELFYSCFGLLFFCFSFRIASPSPFGYIDDSITATIFYLN